MANENEKYLWVSPSQNTDGRCCLELECKENRLDDDLPQLAQEVHPFDNF